MRNQVLSRVMSSARYRITAAGVGEEPAESGSCGMGQAPDHPSGFLGLDPCVPRL